jgi:hypothetical protein
VRNSVIEAVEDGLLLLAKLQASLLVHDGVIEAIEDGLLLLA